MELKLKILRSSTTTCPSLALETSGYDPFIKTKVWDLRKNDEPVVALCNNVKTVNSVYVSEAENRLFTGSIDSHLKVYDMTEVKPSNSSSK